MAALGLGFLALGPAAAAEDPAKEPDWQRAVLLLAVHRVRVLQGVRAALLTQRWGRDPHRQA